MLNDKRMSYVGRCVRVTRWPQATVYGVVVEDLGDKFFMYPSTSRKDAIGIYEALNEKTIDHLKGAWFDYDSVSAVTTVDSTPEDAAEHNSGFKMDYAVDLNSVDSSKLAEEIRKDIDREILETLLVEEQKNKKVS